MRFRMMVLATLAMIGPAAAETVQLYAAGSLRGALTEIAKAYESSTGNKVEAKYGPSGLLKTEISAGAKADVFASANMEHPQALHDEKKGGPVLRFARNKLCALVRPGFDGRQRQPARAHARSEREAGHLDTEGRSVRRLRF